MIDPPVMTDYEKMKEMFDSFDMEYRIEPTRECHSIILQEGMRKVEGYSCFYTSFNFTKKGKFIEAVILE